jgi:hypothetical protein
MLAARHCQTHSQRAAFAVCMKCRKPLCQECATQWDGIYHCAQCLAAQRGTAAQGRRWTGWLMLVAAVIILLYVSAQTMVWAGALIAGLV